MSRTVLVAEDEFLIAMDVMDELDAAGFQTVGPFAEAGRALDFCRTRVPDCAVLDVRLRDGESYPLADFLAERRVPVVFHSAHASKHELAARYPTARVCPKPSPTTALARTVAELVNGGEPQTGA